MNEQWKNLDADAHEAKAEALNAAIEMLDGVTPALDAIEQRAVFQTTVLLREAAKKHEEAAKLGRAA